MSSGQPKPSNLESIPADAFRCQFRQEPAPPIRRIEWIAMGLLLVGSVACLFATGFGLIQHEAGSKTAAAHSQVAAKVPEPNTLGENAANNEDDVDIDIVSIVLALFFAISWAMFGFSLLWVRRLWQPKWASLGWFSKTFPHLPHEVGMAFIVGAVVFVCVEFTLRFAEERSSKKSYAEFRQQLRIGVNNQLAGFQEKLVEAKKNQAVLQASKQNLVSVLNGLALAAHVPIEAMPSDRELDRLRGEVSEFTKAHNTLEKMSKDEEIDAPALRFWESKFLDAFGVVQRLTGDLPGAENSFQQALAVNLARFQHDPTDEERLHFLLGAYRKVIGISVCRMMSTDSSEYKRAVAYQTKAADWLKALAAAQVNRKENLPRASDFTIQRTTLIQLLAEAESRRLDELLKTTFPPIELGKPFNEAVGQGDLLFFKQDSRLKETYKPRCKVYAVQLEKGTNYTFHIDPTGNKPIDAYLLLQTGLSQNVVEEDRFGAGKAEEFTVRIRHTETYRLFVGSSPRPLPDTSPDTGGFILTITAVKE